MILQIKLDNVKVRLDEFRKNKKYRNLIFLENICIFVSKIKKGLVGFNF